MSKRQRLFLALAAVALAAAVGATSMRGSTHYALGPLRDCMAQRGGLVTAVAQGTASEGTATLDVGGDTALLSFAADSREADRLAGSFLDVERHANLVVSAGAPGPFGSGGKLALKTVNRCLSAGHGHVTDAPFGFRYPPEVVWQFQEACRRVRASQAQCRCALTGAQAHLPLADFERAVNPATDQEALPMEVILDDCRLVG